MKRTIAPLLGLFLCLAFMLPTQAWAERGLFDYDNTFEWASLETYSYLTIGIDWLQTKEIVKSPRWFETNETMGREPDMHDVNQYFTAMLISHWVVNRYAHPRFRLVVNIGRSAVQTQAIWNNHDEGIRINISGNF